MIQIVFFVRGGHSTINVMMISRGCLYFLRNIHLVLLDAFNDEKSRRIIYLRNIVLVFNG